MNVGKFIVNLNFVLLEINKKINNLLYKIHIF